MLFLIKTETIDFKADLLHTTKKKKLPIELWHATDSKNTNFSE